MQELRNAIAMECAAVAAYNAAPGSDKALLAIAREAARKTERAFFDVGLQDADQSLPIWKMLWAEQRRAAQP